MDHLSVNTAMTANMPVSSMAYETHTAANVTTPVPETSKDMRFTDQAKVKSENVDMQELTEKLNTISEDVNLSVSFAYNEKINRVYINVIDKNSGDVIRKLPSEEAMKFAESMHDILGTLFDKKG